MKKKYLFKKALRTLLYSWSNDTPAEAILTLRELIDWFNAEYETKLPELKFDEHHGFLINDEELLEAIDLI